MDGFELYIKIREKDPKVKIYFFTATAMFNEEIKKAPLALGKIINEDYFIQKTIRIEVLIKKITLIMNKNKNKIFNQIIRNFRQYYCYIRYGRNIRYKSY